MKMNTAASNLSELIYLSKIAGVRFDLVQAGGGNTSVKGEDNKMLVKASGVSLADVSGPSDFVEVDYEGIRQFFKTSNFAGTEKREREKLGAELLKNLTITDTKTSSPQAPLPRPSIETFLHGMLKKYTLHTHPIVVNVAASRDGWRSFFNDHYEEAVCVEYETPGIDLAIALHKQLEEKETLSQDGPTIVFLQNHGLIVSGDVLEEVVHYTNQIVDKLESALELSFSRYRQGSRLRKLLEPIGLDDKTIFHCADPHLEKLVHDNFTALSMLPFCPDTLVYCGVKPLIVETPLTDLSQNDIIPLMDSYLSQYGKYPAVILIDKSIFVLSVSVKKARETEDLFRFHLEVINADVSRHTDAQINSLTVDEIAYLSNWDAEKYRQEI